MSGEIKVNYEKYTLFWAILMIVLAIFIGNAIRAGIFWFLIPGGIALIVITILAVHFAVKSVEGLGYDTEDI
jgi:hypothetical protein